MATRLILLCCGATASARAAAFPRADEPLDADGARKAALVAAPHHRQAFASPAAVALETAALIGLTATIAPLLADADAGAWAGRALADVQSDDPAALAVWLTDPAVAPPGGESLTQVAARIAPWLDRIAATGEPIVAVTHAPVIRAIIARALAIPLVATLAIDIAPLSETRLSFNRRWRLQGLRN